MKFPDKLFDLIFFSDINKQINELATLAEPEKWDYQIVSKTKTKPILHNYLKYTYTELVQENKIEISQDKQYLTFNTGLVTTNQEPIFIFCTKNRNSKGSPWYCNGWRRKGEHDMTNFTQLPEMAHYFDDPSVLVFDYKKELLANIEHIINDNKERFPEPYKSMPDHTLNILLKGAIDSAKERVKRNYKTAIPHYYNNRIQLLLPLCFAKPNKADLAIVVENMGTVYRAATCLTLDMAYNNARQLVRPDTDWLIP